MKDPQQTWKDLVHKHGEQEARQILSDSLKEAAQQVLTKTYPDVFGCELREPENTFIYTISITLSYPWPG